MYHSEYNPPGERNKHPESLSSILKVHQPPSFTPGPEAPSQVPLDSSTLYEALENAQNGMSRQPYYQQAAPSQQYNPYQAQHEAYQQQYYPGAPAHAYPTHAYPQQAQRRHPQQWAASEMAQDPRIQQYNQQQQQQQQQQQAYLQQQGYDPRVAQHPGYYQQKPAPVDTYGYPAPQRPQVAFSSPIIEPVEPEEDLKPFEAPPEPPKGDRTRNPWDDPEWAAEHGIVCANIGRKAPTKANAFLKYREVGEKIAKTAKSTTKKSKSKTKKSSESKSAIKKKLRKASESSSDSDDSSDDSESSSSLSSSDSESEWDDSSDSSSDSSVKSSSDDWHAARKKKSEKPFKWNLDGAPSPKSNALVRAKKPSKPSQFSSKSDKRKAREKDNIKKGGEKDKKKTKKEKKVDTQLAEVAEALQEHVKSAKYHKRIHFVPDQDCKLTEDAHNAPFINVRAVLNQLLDLLKQIDVSVNPKAKKARRSLKKEVLEHIEQWEQELKSEWELYYKRYHVKQKF